MPNVKPQETCRWCSDTHKTAYIHVRGSFIQWKQTLPFTASKCLREPLVATISWRLFSDWSPVQGVIKKKCQNESNNIHSPNMNQQTGYIITRTIYWLELSYVRRRSYTTQPNNLLLMLIRFFHWRPFLLQPPRLISVYLSLLIAGAGPASSAGVTNTPSISNDPSAPSGEQRDQPDRTMICESTCSTYPPDCGWFHLPGPTFPQTKDPNPRHWMLEPWPGENCR